MNEAWDGQPVKSPCSSCGSVKWSEMRTLIEDKVLIDSCSECSRIRADGVPDVYLPRSGMEFQALCDKTGKPIPIQSKRHKQQVMNELGVREHPDRLKDGKSWVEGSRDYRKRNFAQDRPKIQEAYRTYLQNVKRRGA